MIADAVFLESGALGVRFWRLDDRYAHAICVADGSTWHDVIRSVEGTAAEPWPSSPPLQTLHTQREPDGRQLALLVGMAGKCHWSASVELGAAAGSIRFDLACRVPAGQVGPLGSSYHALRCATAVDWQQIVLTGGNAGGGPLAFCVDERFEQTQLVVSGETIRVELARCGDTETARTVRWGYTVAPARA